MCPVAPKVIAFFLGAPETVTFSILSIENDEAKSMDKSILIKQFAAVNAVREKKF